jgi:hypothetical protein
LIKSNANPKAIFQSCMIALLLKLQMLTTAIWRRREWKGHNPMFFIRAAFWLSLVILLIPTDDGTDKSSAAEGVSAVQALDAAQSAISDMGSLCRRNPDVCDTGGAFLQTFGNKARKGAQMLYHYLDETFGEPQRTVQQPENPATLSPATPRPATPRPVIRGTGTLTSRDLRPDWRRPRRGDPV